MKKQAQPRTNRTARASAPASKPAKVVIEARRGTIDYLDAKNGFRDLNFGQPDSTIANLVEVNHDDARQLKICTRSDESLSLYDVPLERIEYRFFRGELYACHIQWKIAHPESALSRPPRTDLSVQLAEEYGPPRKRRVTKESVEYVWRGRRVELMLIESLMPGVADYVKGGWGLPPTTVGHLTIRNLTLARAVEGRPPLKGANNLEEF